jgi:hypothetical protein
MKKIGLLMLTLVIALGALGIGYAAWTDQIDITGTVDTGSLNIDVTGYSGTWVYKVPGAPNIGFGAETVVIRGDPADLVPPANGILIAHSVAMPKRDEAGALVDDAIQVEFDNIFPDIEFEADAYFTYTGSVPAIVDLESVNFTGDFAKLDPYIEVHFASSGMALTNGVGPDVNGPVQLHHGDVVHIWMTLVIPEKSELMNLSGGFSAVIKATQWNEYPRPV